MRTRLPAGHRALAHRGPVGGRMTWASPRPRGVARFRTASSRRAYPGPCQLIHHPLPRIQCVTRIRVYIYRERVRSRTRPLTGGRCLALPALEGGGVRSRARSWPQGVVRFRTASPCQADPGPCQLIHHPLPRIQCVTRIRVYIYRESGPFTRTTLPASGRAAIASHALPGGRRGFLGSHSRRGGRCACARPPVRLTQDDAN